MSGFEGDGLWRASASGISGRTLLAPCAQEGSQLSGSASRA